MTELFETGLILMMTGMGTVFVLLAVLVLVVRGVSAVSRWISPIAATPSAPPPSAAADSAASESELATVIGAAVSAYRRARQNESSRKS